MRRLILLFTLPLILLAGLYTPDSKPEFQWLYGCWHDPEHPSTRLLWTATSEQGAIGLLTSQDQTAVFRIAADGRLTIRNLGAHLSDTSPPREQRLLEQAPQELSYPHVQLRYLSTRTDRERLQLDWNGHALSFQKDSEI